MKKPKIIICFILINLLLSCGGPRIYKSIDLENSKPTMKTIAIIPFSVSNDIKRFPKGTSIESLKQEEDKAGFEMQEKSYSWLLQRQNNYTVSFQDIYKTNVTLKKQNINNENINLIDKGELCKILGVDGIISGRITIQKLMSEGGAIATTILFGGFSGSTSKSTASLSIHNGLGVLLWKYDNEINGTLGFNPESLVNSLFNEASKKFPYVKRK